MKIGNKLRKMRELHNFTQEFIASEISISTSQYCKYEKDETPINLEMLEKIAFIDKIEIIQFLQWDEKNIFNINNNKSIIGIPQSENTKNEKFGQLYIEQLRLQIEFLKQENSKLWKIIDSRE